MEMAPPGTIGVGMIGVGMIGSISSLARELPDGIDSERAEQIVIALLAVCVIGVFFVIRTVQKAVTRLVLVGVLVALGAGLWVQRDQLQDCAGQCSCHLFGQDVKVPDPQGGCP